VSTLEVGFRMGDWLVEPRAGLLHPPRPFSLRRRSAAAAEQHVEPKVMRVLLTLAANAGEFVSKDQLIDQVWDGRAVSDDALTRTIHALRSALNDDARNPRFIETRSHVGYRLLAPVAAVAHRRLRSVWVTAAVAAVLGLLLIGASSLSVPGKLAPTSAQTIAVLPFIHLSNSKDDSYLAAAMTESLILSLAQLSDFQVISRTSVMHLADYQGPIETVARQLGADLIVEGSVQTTDDQVRVVAQLIDPYSDGHLWAQRYDRPIDDVLTLQQDVSAAIALQVGGLMNASQPPADPLPADVMHIYLQARYLLAQAAPDPVAEALDLFAGLSERFPKFAPAYLGKAQALLYLFKHQRRDSALLGLALEHGRKYETLVGASSESHRCIGQLQLMLDWDLKGAAVRYRSALAMNPSDTVARRRYAWLLVAKKDYALAAAQIRQVRLLDPLYYDSAELATLMLYSGQVDAAMKEFSRLDRSSDVGKGELRAMGMAYLAGGHDELARDSFARMMAVAGHGDLASFRQMSLAQLYQQIIDARPFRSPIAAAGFHNLLGNTAAALGELEQAMAQRDPYVLYLGSMPELKSLKIEPQFLAMLEATGVLPKGAAEQRENRLSSANISNPQLNQHD